MNEVIVKYKNQKALKALEELGKYLGFSVSGPVVEDKTETNKINGVPIVRGNPTIDIQELNKVFTGKDIDATALRKSAWQRNK